MKRSLYEQLDEDTLAYLKYVRNGRGRGAPGIFLPINSNTPIWAFLTGLVILPLFLWIGYTSSKAGWAVAMLQTAGVVLGGWLIVFAFRRWLANPDKYAGHFVYFDPEQVYYGLGEEIQIAKVGRDPQVSPRGENMVRFDTERGIFNVPALSRVLAQYVTDYYEALKWVQSRTEGRWVDVTSAEAGAVARFLVEEDREPNTIADTGLEVEEIPNDVRISAPGFGLLRYLIVLGAAVGVFALFATTNPSIQDDMAFDAAKEQIGKEKAKGITGAWALRDYLLNDRHQRHRTEAQKLLSDLYTAPIESIKNNGNADPALRDEVVSLLNDLRTAETPAISIRVLVDGTELSGERGKQIRSLFADGFATAVGKDLVLCAGAAEGKKAHIEVSYRREANTQAWLWAVEVRTSINQVEPARGSGKTLPLFGTPAFPGQQMIPDGEGGVDMVPEPFKDVLDIDNAVYKGAMVKMVGVAPERPMVPTN